MRMRRLLWLPFLFAAAFQPLAVAQDSLEERLNSDRVGYIEPGNYLAGDRVAFSIDAAGQNYYLRLDGSPEVFVLYQDRVAMGGRVLKFDSGETALSVSGWGGGLPAERTGDSTPPSLMPASTQDIQSAAADEAQHLSYTRRLNISFTANWSALSGDLSARSLLLDTMENTARGIDRFSASGAGHDALARRVESVAFEEASRPTITMNGRTLVVTFNPRHGYIGRASSRAIDRALGKILSAQRPPG
jgi:hypothetical protein